MVLAVIIGIVIATCCSVITVGWIDQQTNAINKTYKIDGEQYYLTDKNGQQIGEGTMIYKASSDYSKAEEQKMRILEIVRTVSIPAYFIISLLMVIFIFYRLKIQRPLKLLDEAAASIAQQNLDFTLHYPIKDEMGNLVASFEQMRRALAKNHQMMWRTAEERKRVNAAFAHDLRTPLTVLKGYNTFLQENIHNPKLTDEKFQSTSQLMQEQINRLEGFVESMSSIQRLEDISPEARQVNSDALIAQIEEITHALQPSQNVSLQSTIQQELNGIDTEIILQVFENLFANALRYAQSEISVQVVEDEQFLTITIEDDGLGFSNDALTNAYARYFADYTGIILLILPIFMITALSLKDQRAGVTSVLYSRSISSFQSVSTRFLAVVCATFLPVLLIAFYETYRVFSFYPNEVLDHFAFVEHAFTWLLPTILVVVAFGFLVTECSGTILAIVLQLVLFFLTMSVGLHQMDGGYSLGLIALRHNIIGNTQEYLECLPALWMNRASYTALAFVLLSLTVVLYERKRKGMRTAYEWIQHILHARRS